MFSISLIIRLIKSIDYGVSNSGQGFFFSIGPVLINYVSQASSQLNGTDWIYPKPYNQDHSPVILCNSSQTDPNGFHQSELTIDENYWKQVHHYTTDNGNNQLLAIGQNPLWDFSAPFTNAEKLGGGGIKVFKRIFKLVQTMEGTICSIVLNRYLKFANY